MAVSWDTLSRVSGFTALLERIERGERVPSSRNRVLHESANGIIQQESSIAAIFAPDSGNKDWTKLVIRKRRMKTLLP
jgi:hypothetical protein